MRAKVWITELWAGPVLALLLTLAALAALPIAHGQERSNALVRGESAIAAASKP